jgi:hypothetical protein
MCHALCARFLTWAVPRGYCGISLLPAFLFVLAGALSRAALAAPHRVIAGKQPARSEGVRNPQGLTDGIDSNEGDDWLTDVTPRFSSSRD